MKSILTRELRKLSVFSENSSEISETEVLKISRNISEYSALLQAYTLMSELCQKFELVAPEISETIESVQGAIRRMTTKGWWLRKLRKVIRQAFERGALELNLVNKFQQIYASDFTVNNRLAQKRKNENILSCLHVVNDAGQKYSLKELSDLNVSNPSVRKAELMVRMRGFENYSLEHGHKGLFTTMTCPSKYHSAYAKSGQRNPNYQGLTPYQGNQYLGQNWQRIRAEFARRDISVYGFRIAEPQHDGTPHWHMLLFTEEKHLKAIEEVITHYSLMEDGDERGAKENRCDFKLIDPKKGSATGYIAKYISKNIDGEHLDSGVYGEEPKSASQRVEAWASCWCIRQFQQIGGASVTVWREMRRLRNSMVEDGLLETIRQAADNSKWSDYLIAMGGVLAKRKDHPIKPAYEVKVDKATGECKASYFDGLLVKALKGIRYQGKLIVTRFFDWRIERSLDRSNLEYCK